ncbi:SpoIIE family protein phosphatase [Candidatus Eisenbacteria bacterium]|uniref:SpoIIE family protein phosphatase n=1 Tax=Eiseniibacteriota bacterium TaxID=2212470 RepID=A0ABV6YI64_UNCEI
MSIRLDNRSSLGEIVAKHPHARIVLEGFGIKCGPNDSRVLADVAVEAGMSLGSLLDTLHRTITERSSQDTQKKKLPAGGLTQMIGYIEGRHHSFLRRELPRLYEALGAATHAEDSRNEKLLDAISKLYVPFRKELESHLRVEELVLFPYIRHVEAYSRGLASRPQLHSGAVPNVIRQISADHKRMLADLARLEEITFRYEPPQESSDELRSLFAGLKALHADLRKHIQLEDGLGRHVEDMETSATARDVVSRDLNTAREVQETIQQGSMCDEPSTEDLAFGVRSAQASEVGGDFYEFCRRDENRIVLALGDVSGKGVPAALLMVMAWTLLRTYVQNEDSPSAALSRMNQALFQSTGLPRFATLFLALYDVRDRTLRYANAGHCEPILCRPDGETIALDSTATVLGAFEEFVSRDEEIKLTPGERLVVYSDGVTEASDANGEMYGLRRLREVIGDGVSLPIDSLLDGIMGSVTAHRGNHGGHDDTTIWAIEIK